MQLPIPRHLTALLRPVGMKNHEGYVSGDIACSCGCSTLRVRYVGDNQDTHLRVKTIGHAFFLVIDIQCEACGRDHRIFDEDFHGWNGFVCTEESKRQLPRPVSTEWACPMCGHGNHVMEAEIYSEGSTDFTQETDGRFATEDWTEAFSWIKLHLQCIHCLKRLKDWISYETM